MDEKQTLCYVVNMLPTLKVHQKQKKTLQSLLVQKHNKTLTVP